LKLIPDDNKLKYQPERKPEDRVMRLSDLLKRIKVKNCSKISDPDIGSIHYKAQDVLPGGLFVAIKGESSDGHDFIDEALARGAAAVVAQKDVKNDGIIIVHENTRKALSGLSAEFYKNPSESLYIIGITGTNGKTTTSYLIESIVSKAGYNVGVIGTINFRYAGQVFENKVTTPESLDLQRILSQMLKKGVTHVVMEVSSHAIELCRIHDCLFDVGVFTNLTQDHLDFHNNMESYRACKKRLFTEYIVHGEKNGAAVVNCNDPEGRKLFHELRVSKVSTGFATDCMIRPEDVKHDLSGISGTICTPGPDFTFLSPMIGNYNLENILCAAGVGAAMNISPDFIKAGIESLSSVPGRLERIENKHNRYVYVDYAHTPDALENVLKTLRSLSKARIICVFGCGGNRDIGKRPKMGRIAAEFSDLAVITSDNPRSESKMEIIDQIAAGVREAETHEYRACDLAAGFSKKGYVVQPDRKGGIMLAVSVSQAGDVIFIAGKGHETYQIIGNKRIDFDDREVVRSAFEGVKS
jgi:UDP-N-acetylmuramyl-tripeptide synthetase